MKDQLITEVQQQMLPYLNNEQLRKLRTAMEFCLHGIEITQSNQQQEQKHTDVVAAFIAAKRIEGCSEKTILYYHSSIEKLLTTSKGKCESIKAIVQHEYQSTGKELRLLVLTDCIRKEYEKAPFRECRNFLSGHLQRFLRRLW